jgi:hypothetical protein
VKLGFVHHTLNPNGYTAAEVPSMLRAIYLFHRDVNGWNDIGYNFAIDLFGRIFEARAGGIDEPVVGAQAGGYNMVSTGVAMLGDFQATAISTAAKRVLQRLIAWKLSLHGVPVKGHVTVRVDPAGAFYSRFPANAKVTLPRVAGHRDADTTDCPGNALYGELPSIRRESARLAGNPASLSLQIGEAPQTQSAPEGSQTPSEGSQHQALSGRLTRVDPRRGLLVPEGSQRQLLGGRLTRVDPRRGLLASEGSQRQLLSGRLTLLDGSPIPNAAVEIQARSVSRRGEAVEERTLATVTTDAEGNWSLPIAISHPEQSHPQHCHDRRKRRRPPEPSSALRALFPGGHVQAGVPGGNGPAGVPGGNGQAGVPGGNRQAGVPGGDGPAATISPPLEVKGILTVGA